MRRVISQMMVSLDGYVAGPNGELDWHVWSDEMEQYAGALLDSVDAILIGRVTYQLFADYWPTATGSIAPKLNGLPKVVFTTTLKEARWKNSRLVRENAQKVILELKQCQGKDLVIFGSPGLVANLVPMAVIDEYQVIVNPVIVGSGRPFMSALHDKIKLKLLNTKTFDCGNVLLSYQRA